MNLGKRKIVFIVMAVISVLILLLLNQLLMNASLRITASDPKKTLPTSQQHIRLTFNRTLAKKKISAKNISFEGDKEFTFVVNGRSLVIHLSKAQQEDSTVVLKLSNITANDGKQMSKTLKFKVAYVAFDRLSEEEKKIQTQSSDSFESDFPLLAELPYIGEDFNVDFSFPPDNEPRMPILVTSTAINFEDPLAPPDSPSNLALLRASRTNAMAWLNERGFDTKKYRLYFGENLLLDEFKGEYDKSILTDLQ